MFIDYSKAFDSLSRNKLFSIFDEIGFLKYLVDLLFFDLDDPGLVATTLLCTSNKDVKAEQARKRL